MAETLFTLDELKSILVLIKIASFKGDSLETAIQLKQKVEKAIAEKEPKK